MRPAEDPEGEQALHFSLHLAMRGLLPKAREPGHELGDLGKVVGCRYAQKTYFGGLAIYFCKDGSVFRFVDSIKP